MSRRDARTDLPRACLLALMLGFAWPGLAADAPPMPVAQEDRTPYLLQPGDLLTVNVWKETELRSDVLVRPDGGLSFPLVGDVAASGRSIEEVRAEIATRLQPFLPSPVVTVALRQIGGNRIYVIGKVNRPGEFPFSRALDVMQALSLAGGGTPYAALNDIVILRREGKAQQAIRFRYGDVERGRDLEQNILLRSGDTVIVP